uniref:Uncharacterized protein n=1 Tax=Xiphophorus maculatus TaxID=8083 RepID=A0A3B5QYS7_XIPMA
VRLEPDEQEAPDDQDSSPPEDTSLYPHSPGTTQFQQNNHPHGQPYTGPAAQHMNNPHSGPRAQETWDGTEEVAPAPALAPAPVPASAPASTSTSTPAPAPPKE